MPPRDILRNPPQAVPLRMMIEELRSNRKDLERLQMEKEDHE